MKKYLLSILLLSNCLIIFSQSIKLENYISPMEFCPSSTTGLKFSARDTYNNKIAGKFILNLYFSNIRYIQDSIQIFHGDIMVNEFDRMPFGTDINTDSNKNLDIEIVHEDPSSGEWTPGFRNQSKSVRMEVKFKPWYSPFWTTENFYFHSWPKEPGKAVVIGENDLFFCSGNEVKTVVIPNAPIKDVSLEECCRWNNDWIWELPSGWKVTSPSGNLNLASNTYQGGDTVKIQAPNVLPTSASINVRSEDSWLWPVNTETEINIGSAPLAASITYNELSYLPVEICYDSNNNSGTFHIQLPPGTNAQSYLWETNAGIILFPNTSFPSVSVTLNSPGLSKYIRVKTINSCGTSAWKTFYFDLFYDALGCSGSGGGPMMMSVGTFPNPTSDELTVELSNSIKSKGTTSETYTLYLINKDLEVVRTKSLVGKKTSLPVDDLPKGTYFLRIVSSLNRTETRQIIIN